MAWDMSAPAGPVLAFTGLVVYRHVGFTGISPAATPAARISYAGLTVS